MTLNVNENKWTLPLIILVSILVFVGIWAYLAGGIFMMAFDKKFDDANPFTMYQYWYYYGEDKQVNKWLMIASGISLGVLLSPLLMFFSSKKPSLYGDARLAKKSEVRKAGLLGAKGIIVGLYMRTYLIYPGSQHVILSAPTRSGKGVGIVVPNLLTWTDSAVVLDIKQENHAITSGYRARHGQPCYLFNPAATDYRSHRYNPLSYVSDDLNFRIDDLQKIGNMLYPDIPGTDVIWTATPRNLFLGITLYLFETPGKLVTLGQVLRESLTEGDGSKYFAKIINDRFKTDKPLSQQCVLALNGYISIASENTRSGVMTTFRSRLELWSNPLVDAATSANDFDLRDVRKKRMTIYLGVTPDNLDRMAFLLNLFFQQLIDLNTRELPERNPLLKYQCLIVADEFTAMGKVNVLSKGISYIAGYGLRLLPIIQSPAQVVEVYGKDAAQTFTTNHALQIVFPPSAKETATAEDISKWLGYQTVTGVSESKAKGFFAKKTPTESQSDQRRALLLPQEITSLGKKNQLIIVEDCPPIMAQRIRYYEDHFFMDRLKSVSPSLRALERKLPSESVLKAIIMAGELAADVPKLDMARHAATTGGNLAMSVVMPTPDSQVQTVTTSRAVTPDDVLNLSKLSLDKFDINFSVFKAPENGVLNVEQLKAYVDLRSKEAGLM